MSSDLQFLSDSSRIRPEKSEVYRLFCDNSKIKALTKFRPQVTIQDGLQKTIDWFTKPENLRKYKSDIYNV